MNKNPNQIKITISGPRESGKSETAIRLSTFLATSMLVDRDGLPVHPKVVNTEFPHTPEQEANADFVITITDEPVVPAAQRDIAFQKAEEYWAQAQGLQKDVDWLKTNLKKTKAERDEAQARVKKLEARIAEHDEELASSQDIARSVIQNLNTQIERLETELEKMKTEYEAFRTQAQTQSKKVEEITIGTFVKNRKNGMVGRIEMISSDGKKAVVDWSGSFGFGTENMDSLISAL